MKAQIGMYGNSVAGKILTVLLSALLMFNSGCAVEMNKSTSKSAASMQSYVWYDGDQERQVWLNPQVVAEFSPDNKGQSSVKSVHPSAEVLQTKLNQGAVRLWKLNATSDSVIGNLKTAQPQGKYSAVFHDGQGVNSRMRALPGNIIVYLDPLWNEPAVNNWLALHKLEVVRKLEIGPNIYLIKTGPGMEALDTANALYRSGEVKAAFPDWWQEVVTR
jgi:hypothetical protein